MPPTKYMIFLKSASLLASIGRLNIAHRYQREDLGAEVVVSAAAARVLTDTGGALASRNLAQHAGSSAMRSRNETVGVDGV